MISRFFKNISVLFFAFCLSVSSSFPMQTIPVLDPYDAQLNSVIKSDEFKRIAGLTNVSIYRYQEHPDPSLSMVGSKCYIIAAEDGKNASVLQVKFDTHGDGPCEISRKRFGELRFPKEDKRPDSAPTPPASIPPIPTGTNHTPSTQPQPSLKPNIGMRINGKSHAGDAARITREKSDRVLYFVSKLYGRTAADFENEFRGVDPIEVLNKREYYNSLEFRKFIKTLPQYGNFIIATSDDIKTNKKLREDIRSVLGFKKSEFQNLMLQLAQEERGARDARAAHEDAQRKECELIATKKRIEELEGLLADEAKKEDEGKKLAKAIDDYLNAPPEKKDVEKGLPPHTPSTNPHKRKEPPTVGEQLKKVGNKFLKQTIRQVVTDVARKLINPDEHPPKLLGADFKPSGSYDPSFGHSSPAGTSAFSDAIAGTSDAPESHVISGSLDRLDRKSSSIRPDTGLRFTSTDQKLITQESARHRLEINQTRFDRREREDMPWIDASMGWIELADLHNKQGNTQQALACIEIARCFSELGEEHKKASRELKEATGMTDYEYCDALENKTIRIISDAVFDNAAAGLNTARTALDNPLQYLYNRAANTIAAGKQIGKVALKFFFNQEQLANDMF